MSWDTDQHNRPKGRKVALLLAALALLGVLVLAGCGSSGSSSSSGGSTEPASSEPTEESKEPTEEGETEPTADSGASEGAPDVSPEELQAAVDNAFETTTVKAESLPPLIQQGLARGIAEPSQEEMDTAYECYKEASCEWGEGELTVGIAGDGETTWRNFSQMLIILQSMTYPDVGKIITTNGNLELATYQSNIRTLTAEGADVIITFNDFGEAAFPAFEAAQNAGVAVASYVSPDEGAPLIAVQPDICQVGKDMAAISKKLVGDEPIAYFTGVAGNSEDAGWQKCATEAGANAVFNGTTEWSPAGAQQAAAALIASGKSAQAILYSYSNPIPSVIKTYQKANKPIPAIITWTQNNETTCQWKEVGYTLWQTNAINWAARVAVTAAMAEVEGEEVEQEVIYPLPFFEAKASQCDPSKPAEYPGKSAGVPEELVKKMLG
jgi:ABC-type sugar transport system substrate-binding protein